MGEFKLGERSDMSALAADFSAKRYIQVPEILDAHAAKAAQKALWSLPWGLCFNEGEAVHQISPDALQRMPPETQRQMLARVHQGAARGFQFLYNFFPMLEAATRLGKEAPMAGFFAFINSAPFLKFVRNVTGNDDIQWADAQATLFQPGHFLTWHDDSKSKDRRVAAYVFGFTEDWGSDWGGYLNFFDERRDVTAAFRPKFNVLSLFAVPTPHAVGVVAPFAKGQRFSVTGWLRTDDPPAEIRVLMK
ncbi:2OG-Fe(II) oxygenase [Pacificimonas sp. WHA3]|uniref:2OG-Fe(II) oxygenase n=1 Tax=Pacificimonas pallii TaxID=2827236 RepID=A0ABS6SFZ7_9SPHN|nr:2OG-Fe(II) oxygenase family protein [Pacificimonas pallii]MBV7257175.1 2OG-Fe(II) oxygenase [Pacificimonas pallii]